MSHDNCMDVIDRLCSEQYSLAEEQAHIRQAVRDEMEVKRGDEHTLTLDLDDEEALETFKCRVIMLARKGFGPRVEITRSKSGNYRAVVTTAPTFPPMTEPMRIALQSILGSDWKREMLGCLRVLNNQPNAVSMLFRPQPLERVPYEIPGQAQPFTADFFADDQQIDALCECGHPVKRHGVLGCVVCASCKSKRTRKFSKP